MAPETKECPHCGEWYEYGPHVCMGKIEKRTIQQGLRILADWLDAKFKDAGTGKDEVQSDLRRWANEVDGLQSEVESLRQNIERLVTNLDNCAIEAGKLRWDNARLKEEIEKYGKS